jgi:uncharacterized protein (TIGR02145 family)
MPNKPKVVLSSIMLISAVLLTISCSSDKSSGPDTVPELTTVNLALVTQTTAQSGGIISSDGGSSITARGVCWSTSANPSIDDNITTDGTGSGNFTSAITGLTGRTLYYIRAYATNSLGTGYGNELSFTTTDSTGTVTDIDDNTYRTVKINNLWWMAANLKVTHYRNGVEIPDATDSASWVDATGGVYCNYNNNSSYVYLYGRLYNWYAVSDTSGLAPEGWHVATDADWQAMVDFLGGDSLAGGKLKVAGIAYWTPPNVGATNESGFSAMPAGFRFPSAEFYGIQAHGNFWTSTTNGAGGYYRFVHCTTAAVAHYSCNPPGGFSVRCVKN